MRARTQRTGIVAVVAAALTMGLTFAHTLELPQKLGYDAAMWTRIQQSLYLWFGVVGGAVEVAAVAVAVVFAVRTRGRPGGRLATGGAALFVAALAWWFAVVNIANAQIGSWTVGAAPADWEHWRAQWEFGHAVHFVLTLAGFLALLLATVQVAAAEGGGDEVTVTSRVPEPALPGERHGGKR
jgi:hypothetical protein